jgi:hypothetical protein
VGNTPSRWVARLVPSAGMDVDTLLAMGLGLDVWERHGKELVVAANDEQLAEVERRLLASVERICTVEAFEQRAPGTGASDHEEER